MWVLPHFSVGILLATCFVIWCNAKVVVFQVEIEPVQPTPTEKNGPPLSGHRNLAHDSDDSDEDSDRTLDYDQSHKVAAVISKSRKAQGPSRSMIQVPQGHNKAPQGQNSTHGQSTLQGQRALQGQMSGAKLWRDDLRCGTGWYLDDKGTPAQCNPSIDGDGSHPCCSNKGWCGNSDAHCKCSGCEDYSPDKVHTKMKGQNVKEDGTDKTGKDTGNSGQEATNSTDETGEDTGNFGKEATNSGCSMKCYVAYGAANIYCGLRNDYTQLCIVAQMNEMTTEQMCLNCNWNNE